MKANIIHSAMHLRRAFTDGDLCYGVRGETFYAYGRPKIENPNTSQQQMTRGAWKATCAAWREMSPELKAGWSKYAKEHDRKFGHEGLERLSGYRLFQKSAGYRQIMGLGIETSPPTAPPPYQLAKLELLPSEDPTTYRFRVTHKLGSGSGLRVILSMTPQTVSVARAPERKHARHIKGWGVESTQPLTASGGVIEFQDARFAVQPGQRFGVWIRVVRESDGLARIDRFHDFIRPEMAPDAPGEAPPQEPQAEPQLTNRIISKIWSDLFGFECMGAAVGKSHVTTRNSRSRSRSGWP